MVKKTNKKKRTNKKGGNRKKNQRLLKDKEKKRGAASKTKEQEQEMERAQVWSVDVLLAVVIFVAVILVFYTSMTQKQEVKVEDLEAEASSLKAELEQNHDISFLKEEEVNQTRLEDFSTKDYDELKKELGIKGEFCIFYEDEEGNLVLVNNKAGIGKGDINICGTPCGEVIS